MDDGTAGEQTAVSVGMESLLRRRTGSMSTGTAIRVGADVVAVHQVADSVDRFGPRYLQRVYTEHELSSCSGSAQVRAASLAARFAAKEATIKVLRPVGHQPDWRSMEVRRHAEGWCTMSLTGHAAALADEAGIAELAVSLTHEGDVAAAVVVALCHRGAVAIDEPELPLEAVDTGRVI
jgi:holo-[acyl-carrier protein] synthase